MSRWTQQRPDWCPYPDCLFKIRSQDSLCIGELPTPLDHAGVDNTHRLCMHGAPDDGEWMHIIELNRGDAWNMVRTLCSAFEIGRDK